jgi:hypothetical protein
MKNEYITPTSETPVFVSTNMNTGEVICGGYKEWELKTDKYFIGGYVTALNLTDAICLTHKYMKEHDLNKNTKFEITMIDGTTDKYGDPVRVKCYSISMRQAKKYRIL